MKRVLALSVLMLLPHFVYASEGRVTALEPLSFDADRVSRYTSGPAKQRDSTAVQSKGADAAKEGVAHTNETLQAEKSYRSKSPMMSLQASHLYIYDADSLLITDRDGDAYHSEFRIRFDVDSTLGDTLVYASLYLRRVGELDWTLYHTTDDFWVDGQSEDDDYFVITALDDGFPTGEYDVLIDIYEPGYSGIAATFGPYDSGALSYLPLEEAGLDVPIELSGYDIHDVRTTLLIDSDADGYYSRFRIAFDPDANVQGGFLYAVIWLRAQGGTWIEEHVSDEFLVDASGGADAYSFTADWIDGYPTSYYDVQIDLFDAATGLLVASAGSERLELSRIPLEDQSHDIAPNPPSGGSSGSASSNEHGGGGALGAWWTLLMLMISLRRAAYGRGGTCRRVEV